MITKEKTTQYPITTEENGVVIFRNRVAIIEDGEETSHSYEHRQIPPGDDYSAEDAQVQKICRALHTKTVINAYRGA